MYKEENTHVENKTDLNIVLGAFVYDISNMKRSLFDSMNILYFHLTTVSQP